MIRKLLAFNCLEIKFKTCYNNILDQRKLSKDF